MTSGSDQTLRYRSTSPTFSTESARPGRITRGRRRPMLGVKQTFRQGHEIDASDPERTSRRLLNGRSEVSHSLFTRPAVEWHGVGVSNKLIDQSASPIRYRRRPMQASRILIASFLSFAAAIGITAAEPKHVPQVGSLNVILRADYDPSKDPWRDILLEGLRAFGYVEGQNIHLDYRMSRME